MKAVHQGFTSGVLSCLFLAGCAAWSAAPQFSQPYFMVDTGEAKSSMRWRKTGGTRPKCAEHNSCAMSTLRALAGALRKSR
jgi:hypothetical protein